MIQSILKHVKITGISGAVPSKVRSYKEDADLLGRDIERIFKNTGVKERHLVDSTLCASDLCLVSAKSLLEKLEVKPNEIDGLIFVSQTPDYILPATSCTLHEKLGISSSCAAFDVNLGCSGYVYGLWMAANFIATGSLKKVLLLAGDTISRICCKKDRATYPLFGDAGSATILEYAKDAHPLYFVLGTDGNGANNLIVPAGSFRSPHSEETAQEKLFSDGSMRSSEQLYMNGAEIFTFTIREVLPMVSDVLNLAKWQLESVDAVVMHQANKFIIQYLSKKIGVVLSGFGVGYSWGSVGVKMEDVFLDKIHYVDSTEV
jgi:3-oxoacyl-[acyl-carrier-protein] synthase-3